MTKENLFFREFLVNGTAGIALASLSIVYFEYSLEYFNSSIKRDVLISLIIFVISVILYYPANKIFKKKGGQKEKINLV
jgi:hypothetical protein